MSKRQATILQFPARRMPALTPMESAIDELGRIGDRLRRGADEAHQTNLELESQLHHEDQP